MKNKFYKNKQIFYYYKMKLYLKNPIKILKKKQNKK